MAVARPVECLQIGAVRAAAVVGPEAVEVGHADDDADIVAGSEDTGGALLDFRTDDVILARRLTVVAGHVNMAERGRTVARCRYIDIGACTPRCCEQQTGGVLIVGEDKLTAVFSAKRCLSLTGS